MKFFLAAFLLIWPHALSAQTADAAKPKKIVFFAGPKDHGPAGRHEYEKDLRVLAQCLETSSNLKGLTTVVHVGSVLTNINEYSDAAVFVILSSGDGNPRETHPLFPPNPTTDGKKYTGETATLLNDFDKMVKAGAGVVVLHYAIQANNLKAREYYLRWLGGLWIPENYSQNPLGAWTVTPIEAAKQHPVLRGVNAWTYRDEIFCKFLAQPLDPKRTDLVLASTEQSNQGKLTNVVAGFAYQRDDAGKGRGFVYGGIDVHAAMLNEDYRRLLLNGIAWAAKMEVPAGGIQSTYTASTP